MGVRELTNVTINLDDPNLGTLSSFEIEQLIQSNVVTVQAPIRRCWSYLDMISDYLDASFAFETLSKLGKTSELRHIRLLPYAYVFEIDISDFSHSCLSTTLKELALAVRYPEDDEIANSDSFNQVRDNVLRHEFEMMNKPLRYPSILEDYFSNLINGAYYECGRTTFGSDLNDHPEREYGFWESAYCTGMDHKVLISRNTWIIPEFLQVSTALELFGYSKDTLLLEGEFIHCKNTSYVLAEDKVIEIPLGSVIQALACYSEYSSDKDDFQERLGNLHSELFVSTPEFKNYGANAQKIEGDEADFSNLEQRASVLVSEFADFVVFNFSTCSVVLFDIQPQTKKQSENVGSVLTTLSSGIYDELQISKEHYIDWLSIDEEIFEQLCWNVIYHHSRFDRNTIRKMGKSKSRDGGRDIEIWTKESVGSPPKKYIFQCKFSKNTNRSVTAINVGSISDVIGQYGAKGYGLMCNCYIDATLFDRLDGISSNQSIATETWDRFQIEKFLSRHPTLSKKFFEHNGI
ncbi:hypothetical protein AB4154_11450 [Vibrio sp. 10N.286.51.B11]|uniref:hypothetical protein n=1 Tax=Vibrio sp. 10N.286.51.B11 TaxID=3229706 RepID=UPI00354E7517